MAEANISVDNFSVDHFSCPVCLDLLTDPVTIICGHSFCKVCINSFWDTVHPKKLYSCPQCRETFTPRPVLRRNHMLAEVVEKLKTTKLQAASPTHCYTGPGDVLCDFCTGRKHKAVKSCLVCQASYCEAHLQPHFQSPAFKKHKLVEVSKDFQEKICSEHDKLMETHFMLDKHKGHGTVTAKPRRTEKQNMLKEEQMKFQQRIQEKQRKIQELKQTVNVIKWRSQAAVEDSEKIFTDLIRSMEKKRSEVTELIRAQEKTELSLAERFLNQVKREITDLQRRVTELEQLSHTDDDIHFLQRFQSLSFFPGFNDSSSFTLIPHPSFDGVRKTLSDLRKQLKMILPSEPKSRLDFLQYFCSMTLDPNTTHPQLILSEKNRAVTRRNTVQRYSDNPERFDCWEQVLCKESVCGRCYWEVEWTGYVFISVSYKRISRKGEGYECRFGCNRQSWSLWCDGGCDFASFYHDNIRTELRGPVLSRIGVYVDHGAGTLSFYSVSDTMKLLHRVHTTFTKPLYAGFCVLSGSSTRLL